jgi:hypothetical protein
MYTPMKSVRSDMGIQGTPGGRLGADCEHSNAGRNAEASMPVEGGARRE